MSLRILSVNRLALVLKLYFPVRAYQASGLVPAIRFGRFFLDSVVFRHGWILLPKKTVTLVGPRHEIAPIFRQGFIPCVAAVFRHFGSSFDDWRVFFSNLLLLDLCQFPRFGVQPQAVACGFGHGHSALRPFVELAPLLFCRMPRKVGLLVEHAPMKFISLFLMAQTLLFQIGDYRSQQLPDPARSVCSRCQTRIIGERQYRLYHRRRVCRL